MIKLNANSRGFTLIEILLVVTIIAILAATVVPNFIGFDTEARITATRSNLETLRTRVTLFRAKEGRYPDSLDELVNTYYLDVGVRKPYLNNIPVELISDKSGNNATIVVSSREEPLFSEGGWVYYTDTAHVTVNFDRVLDKRWGEYEGQNPSRW